MNFYRKSTEEIISKEIMIARYGTCFPIPELGIEYVSVAFDRLSNQLAKVAAAHNNINNSSY
jgi:hypothetical protein